MPIYQCPNKKYKIGKGGKCKFSSRAAAEKAFAWWVKNHPGEDAAKTEEEGLPEDLEGNSSSGNNARRALLSKRNKQ